MVGLDLEYYWLLCKSVKTVNTWEAFVVHQFFCCSYHMVPAVEFVSSVGVTWHVLYECKVHFAERCGVYTSRIRRTLSSAEYFSIHNTI